MFSDVSYFEIWIVCNFVVIVYMSFGSTSKVAARFLCHRAKSSELSKRVQMPVWKKRIPLCGSFDALHRVRYLMVELIKCENAKISKPSAKMTFWENMI